MAKIESEKKNEQKRKEKETIEKLKAMRPAAKTEEIAKKEAKKAELERKRA